jgi:predicted ester cyclase
VARSVTDREKDARQRRGRRATTPGVATHSLPAHAMQLDPAKVRGRTLACPSPLRSRGGGGLAIGDESFLRPHVGRVSARYVLLASSRTIPKPSKPSGPSGKSSNVGSPATNAEVARELIDAGFNRGDLTVRERLLDAAFVEHQRLPPGIPPTVDALRAIIGALRAGFPDFRLTIEQLDSVQDRVWLRMRGTGTHRGEFMDSQATGRRIAVGVIDVVRRKGGRVIEHWGVPDQLTVMEQLGALGPE